MRNEEEIKKIALSKTVVIENLSLYLGLTAKEIIRWIKDSLVYHGERGDITIIDFNLNPFNVPFNNTSISLQVADVFMVARLKRLDSTMCLGQKIRVRKSNEETSQTNAQASAIAIQSLIDLKQSRFQTKTEAGAPAIEIGNLVEFKHHPVSRIIKICNAHDREQPLS